MPGSPYVHLGLGERKSIIELRSQGLSCREIAKRLGRSHSTISRELERNIHRNSDHAYYTFRIAHRKAMGRRSRARKKTQYTIEQWRQVEGLIRQDWSPEQVAHVLSKHKGLSICHETIYRYIYKDKRLKGTLYLHLRLRCRKRRKRYRAKDSRGVLRGKTMITERPKEIDERKAVGHWEVDTVMGKGGKDCILTLVERKTGLVLIGKLKERKAACLNSVLVSLAKSSPIPFLTITADNGSEFHGYKSIEAAIGAKVYFALPHHAWERGTNENTNGLIRQYLPKGESMKDVSQETCNQIARRLNSRPRKRLGYKTPLREAEEAA